MRTLVLCEVTVATLSNPTPRTGYQLFSSADAPAKGRIATITGTVSGNTKSHAQLAYGEPMRGDVLPYYDDFIEVHEVDWIFVP